VSDPGLRELVEALPFRDRTVVVLHYGHGLTLEEIARLLGEKPTTIRSVLFRARARLRADLSDE
jgi:RNA polymerase sigma-70 factor (ECF subfamily)